MRPSRRDNGEAAQHDADGEGEQDADDDEHRPHAPPVDRALPERDDRRGQQDKVDNEHQRAGTYQAARSRIGWLGE